jgi:hypothetical protein
MMTNAELIKALRWCGSENNEWCVGEIYKCPLWNEDRITDECKAELMRAAADALEAADEKITKLENPKAYIAVDFKGDYVLCQANYVYSDGTRISSEIAEVRIPLKNYGNDKMCEDDPLRPMWPNWD